MTISVLHSSFGQLNLSRSQYWNLSVFTDDGTLSRLLSIVWAVLLTAISFWTPGKLKEIFRSFFSSNLKYLYNYCKEIASTQLRSNNRRIQFFNWLAKPHHDWIELIINVILFVCVQCTLALLKFLYVICLVGNGILWLCGLQKYIEIIIFFVLQILVYKLNVFSKPYQCVCTNDVWNSVPSLPVSTSTVVHSKCNSDVWLVLVRILFGILRQLLGNNQLRQGNLIISHIVTHCLQYVFDVGNFSFSLFVAQQLLQDFPANKLNLINIS